MRKMHFVFPFQVATKPIYLGLDFHGLGVLLAECIINTVSLLAVPTSWKAQAPGELQIQGNYRAPHHLLIHYL